MKKKIIIVILITIILIIIGTTLFLIFNKDPLNNAYNKMQISENKLTGYTFDLRIISYNKDRPFIYMVNIKNYMNEVYKVNLIDLSSLKNNFFNVNKNINYIYIKDNIVYKKNSKNIYEKTDDEVLYFNSNIYLDGINNIDKINKKDKVKISKNSYTLYKVDFKNKYGNTLAKYLELDNIFNSSSKINGEIYLDKRGYVYKIKYRFEKIMIMTTYYDFNKIKKIEIPNN